MRRPSALDALSEREFRLFFTAQASSFVGDGMVPVALAFAVLNVVDNAIKYTPEGGSVAVRGRKVGGYVVIDVRDTGIGIPVNAIPHIFERFYRADWSRAKDIEGVGLGLNLAKWILDHHGGDIYVTSEVGKGSDFGLRVPAF